MQHASYTVSVPGSIMLLGEHAVLHGYRALACAINHRIFASLTPRSDKKIIIISDLGTYETTINSLSMKSPFQFVLAAIEVYQPFLVHGFNLKITTEFSHKLGFGSSAAVTVAVLSLLQKWLHPDIETSSLIFFQQCLTVVRKVQRGLGSGADIAASIWGGVISIKTKPLVIEKLPIDSLPLEIVYSGCKTPTVTVINHVSQLKQKYPILVEAIFRSIGECAEIGYEALLQKDWTHVGEIFLIQQSLLHALDVSNKVMDEIIRQLQCDPGILGAKISGSGLGDCIVGLGHLTRINEWQRPHWLERGVIPIPIQMCQQGALNEGQ